MFQGCSEISLDGKGRFAIPTKWRDKLVQESGGVIVLTKHKDGGLLVFPAPIWEGFVDKLSRLGVEADGIRQMYIGFAENIDISEASRILIPPVLRKYAGLTQGGQSIYLMGLGDHLQIWEVALYDQREAYTKQMPMPESVAQLSYGR